METNMNAKKKRNKNRRRARKLAEQAWEAADGDNFDLAVKIIRRAVDQDPANPVIWNDQGLLLRNPNELEKAAESFQAAISLAADFADAYANLPKFELPKAKSDKRLSCKAKRSGTLRSWSVTKKAWLPIRLCKVKTLTDPRC